MTVSDSLKTKRTELQTMLNQYKTLYTEAEQKGADKVTADERQKLDNIFEAGKKLRAEVDQLEFVAEQDARLNQPGDAPKAQEAVPSRAQMKRTWGQIVTMSEQFKQATPRWSDGKMERVNVGGLDTKAVVSDATAGGFNALNDRQAEIVDVARMRPRTVLDLLNRSQTGSDAVEYIEITSITNNAAPVAEYSGGSFGLKPQSDMAFNLRTAAVKTIATWIPASRQILADAPQLRALIDNELAYMVDIDLETQVLTGDGTGSNFTGMLNWSGIQTRVMHATTPVGRGQLTTDTKLDTIRRAITDMQLAFYEATGVVMNPADAEAMELIKTTTNQYVNVYDPIQQRVWRVPVTVTPAITALTALVGNFALATRLWDRLQTEIRVGEPNDYFLRNAVAVLAEIRAAFAVVRPQALEKVTLI